MSAVQSNEILLDIQNLRVDVPRRGGRASVVDGVSLTLRAGEAIGIVGESGSGKSLSMLSITGLTPPGVGASGGVVLFEGQDLLKASEKQLQAVRGNRIGYVFQDPMTSFNPVMRIGDQLSEPLIYHKGLSKDAAWAEAGRLLELVNIPGGAARLHDYPHQLSGGMRQRCMIAMAVACGPALLIADEPTTALDVTTQADVVALIRDLRRELGLAVAWISHDLGLVSQVVDRIAVLYSGRIVEEGPAATIIADPRHPYTKALIASIPGRGLATPGRHLPSIPGVPPDLANRPVGCAFGPRCRARVLKCATQRPELKPLAPNHSAACFVAAGEVA